MQISKIKFSPNFNIYFFIKLLLCLVVILSTALYAQDESHSEITQIQEDHDTKNLGKLLKDYNHNAQKVIQDSEKMLEADDSVELSEKGIGGRPAADSDLMLEEKMSATASKGPSLKSGRNKVLEIKKPSYYEAINAALIPLQKLTEAQLSELLKESFKNYKAAQFLVNSPKFMLIIVRLIQDKKALPYMAKILDDQDKLIKFSLVLLSTLLLALILKNIMRKKGRPIYSALAFWFIRFSIINFIRYIIILIFYGNEISPTLNIASKIFFS